MTSEQSGSSGSTTPQPPRHRRRLQKIRLAGVLVTFGLIVEVITMRWAHPTAFLVFALGSGASIALGGLLFLSTLIATGPDQPS